MKCIKRGWQVERREYFVKKNFEKSFSLERVVVLCLPTTRKLPPSPSERGNPGSTQHMGFYGCCDSQQGQKEGARPATWWNIQERNAALQPAYLWEWVRMRDVRVFPTRWRRRTSLAGFIMGLIKPNHHKRCTNCSSKKIWRTPETNIK